MRPEMLQYHMDTCPDCGGDISDSTETCPACGHERAEQTEDGGDPTGTGVSRRGLLVYSGSAMALTWAGFGAGWFALVYEQVSPPEKVVREYVDALDRSKFYTAEQLFHEDAPGDAWGPDDLPEISRLSLTVEDTEVTDRETDVPRQGVTELALVVATITIATTERSNTTEVPMVVAKNDAGEWKLWEDR